MDLKNYRILDAHCDTIGELWRRGGSLQKNDLTLSLDRLSAYGGYIQFFALWLDDACDTPLQEVLQLIDVFYRELEHNTDRLLPVLTAADCEKAFAQGKIGALLTAENGNALEGSLANLRLLYRLGVRALTLTWNGANELCDGIGEGRGGGLTDFGRTVVEEMNRLGMMIDVSHLSVRGFWDVLETSKAPVMASHSNALAVAGHPRNLSNDQIRGLAERGGVIGLNMYPAFLSDSGRAGITDCLRHIEHILSVGGEDCLGLGSDFDGFETSLPEGIAGPQEYYRLFSALEQAGYPARLISKITHENIINFSGRVLK